MTKTNNDTPARYEGIILEDIQESMAHLAEGMSGMLVTIKRMDKRLIRVEKNTELMLPVIEAAVKDQTKQLHNQERRITKLEGTA